MDAKPSRTPPLAVVFKDKNTWEWQCRLPMCGKTDWRVTHKQALADVDQHLQVHRQFGFGKR